MPTKKAPPSIFQLKITLLGIEPPIWRRIHVSSTIRLCCLHNVLQAVMGWTDSHLHQFEKDGKSWGMSQYFEDDDIEVIFDPGHKEFEHFVGWAGGPFHAEQFDLMAVSHILFRMRWPVRHRR
jgi:hypothetical protein